MVYPGFSLKMEESDDIEHTTINNFAVSRGILWPWGQILEVEIWNFEPYELDTLALAKPDRQPEKSLISLKITSILVYSSNFEAVKCGSFIVRVLLKHQITCIQM